MATNDDGRFSGGGSGAPRPTSQLRGVQFLGGPSVAPAGDQYYLKRPDGAISGPHSQGELAGFAHTGALTGDEGVSRDGQLWIPVMAMPELATLFRPASSPPRTMMGGLGAVPSAPPAREGGGAAALTGSHSSLLDDAYESPFADRPGVPSASVPAAGGFGSSFGSAGAPAPLGGSGLGIAADNNAARMASGAWSAMPDDFGGTDVSVSKAVAPNPDALSNLPGVRRLTGANPASLPDSTVPSLPRGFGGPGALEGSGELPLPPMSARGTDVLPPISAQRGPGVLDLPAARMDLPPVSAQNLPRPVGTSLPMSAGAGLPAPSGSGLPVSGAAFPASANQAPGSTLTSPSSRATWGEASGLNLSGLFDVGGGSAPPRPATQAMGAFGDEPELPGAVDPRSRAPELPTSTRGSASMLDQLGESEDLWAEQGAVGAGSLGATGGRSAQDDFAFGNDPFAQLEEAGSAAPMAPASNEFSGFFDANASKAAPMPEASTGASAPVARPKMRGSSPVAAVAVGAVVLLGAAGAGLWYFVFKPEPVVEAPVVAPEPATVVSTVASLPEITEIRTANYLAMEAYAQNGRQAIASGHNNVDRARTMVALGLMLAENPAAADLASELERLNGELDPADTSATASLARGAYAAATGTSDPAEMLAGVLSGGTAQEQAFAHTLLGIYAVQYFRGVDYAPAAPEAPVEAAAAGSGEGSGGSGEGSAEATAAAEGSVAAPAPELAPLPAVEAPRALDAAVAAHFDAALAADSELAAARYWRGWVALQTGDAPAAERAFQQVVEAQAQHVAAQIGVTRAMLAQGRLSDADGRVQRVIDEMEGASAPHERAETFLVSGQVAVARLQPELAIESLLSALQVDPASASALEMLGDQFYEAGQYARALEYFQANTDLVQNVPGAALGLARGFMGMGSLEEATNALTAAAEQFPRDGRFPYYLGRVKEEQTEFEAAEASYQRAIQVDPTFLMPYAAMADLQKRKNDLQGARRWLDDAMALNPADAATANMIGEGYLALGETNAAVAAFRRALSINQSYARARINLTDYYLTSGQNLRALDELQAMLNSGVDSPSVRYLYGRALGEQGQFDRGIEELLALLEDDGDNPSYLFQLGRLQFLSGVAARADGDEAAASRAFDTARTNVLRTLDEQPSHQEAMYYLGRIDIERGDFASAITSLTTVSDRSAGGQYHYWLGYALELGDQATQAMQEYGEAVEQDIGWSLENPDVFYRRGRLLQIRGALPAAYRDLQIVLTLRPEHAPAAWILGRVYFEERKWNQAIASIEWSLQHDPNQPLAHYYAGLAYLNLEQPVLESALAHLEAARAGNLGERYPDVHQRLGFVYRDLGRGAEAIAAFGAYLDVPSIPYEERRATENEIRRLGGQP